MPDYDFHTLSPLDLEHLTRDLLQARDGAEWESFKTGRDRGVDLRRAVGPDHAVAQCKHYARSGLELLLRDLTKEAAKIATLGPTVTRYLVSTSVDLSFANKQKIASLFGDICTTADILGRDDLNNLLGLYPEVERRHFKLWLSSTAVMQQVLHNAEATQSAFEVARVQRNVARFVATGAYPTAHDRLARERVVILSGAPGVGKTTLAEMLLYEELANGSQAIVARNGFEEARRLYAGKERAVFYYDDFLGATFLGEGGDPLVRNQDRAVADFLEFVLDNPQTRLILTTREHLLTQAIAGSERLRRAMLNLHKVTVTLGAMTSRQRARILYNHLYFGDLPPAYRDLLLADDFYFEIIQHKKFSPRLVEWLSSHRRVRDVPPDQYRDFVRRLLADPAEIWRHAYEQQIGEAERSLLLALHSLGGTAPVPNLEAAFRALHQHRSARYGFRTAAGDFGASTRNLAGAFLQLRRDAVEFLDPSVIDLMNAVLREAPENALDVVRSAVTIGQIEHCWALSTAEKGEQLRRSLLGSAEVLHDGLKRALQAGEGPLLEHRIIVALTAAREVGTASFDTLLTTILQALLDDWRSHDEADFEDGVEIIQLISAAPLPSGLDLSLFAGPLTEELLRKAAISVEPEQAQALLQILPESDGEILHRIGASLQEWLTHHFGDRLRHLRSSREFRDFIACLEDLEDRLGIDLEPRIDALRTELEEFEAHEEDYADQQMDAYKEQRYEQRAEEASVRDLFDSLPREG